MGRRAREALIALALAASAQHLAAQNPPPAPAAPPRDSLAREQIYNDIIPPGAAFAPRVPLVEGTVYRVEIQPATATVSIRSAGRPTLPPLFMVPLEGGGGGASQTSAFLIVPRSTEEYRFDVTVYGTEPVRLRVETDPREMSRYARMREATKNLPAAGVSLRAVYIGPFVRPRSSYSPPPPRGNAAASGVEACFAVVPHGTWSAGRLGGCLLAVARLQRPDTAGALWYFGTEPEIGLSAPGSAIEQSVTLTIGIASADNLPSGNEATDYVVYALGYRVVTRLVGRHLYADAEASVASARENVGFLNATGKGNIVPRLALGMQFRF
jgi:hypothetical protein